MNNDNEAILDCSSPPSRFELEVALKQDSYCGDGIELPRERVCLRNECDIATCVISVDDDESLNPWTLRAFFIGIGLSAFGSVLAEIYAFKPQFILVSTLFLAIIAYCIGVSLATIIPRWGYFRYLNPGPFNKKENVFVVIMASAAANSALGTEVLATQRLFYDITPTTSSSIFLLFSSQILGYGLGGLMRSTLLYPSKMLYPVVLPLVSMLDALYKYGADPGKKLKLFYSAFFAIFVWEIFPEWIFPLLTGFSIFCIANPTSAHFTRIFGGSNGNEGLGVLSLCFDWQYISGGVNPMTIPLQAHISNFIGYVLCIAVFVAIYYGNVWNAQNFPFLSQLLFYENGTAYDQLLILNDKYEVDPDLLAVQGLPYYAATWVTGLLAWNIGMAATFTHLLLWNRDDIRCAWSWMKIGTIRKMWSNFNWKFWQDDGIREQLDDHSQELDPHYREMLKYPDAPRSWYIAILLISIAMALVVIYKADSTLPWWGLAISVLLATVSLLFLGALYAFTGLSFIVQPFMQMVGGFLHPGKPMANMYFVLFSYNSILQASLLLKDLKIAQYTKLPPRAAFTAQILGTICGAVLNYVVMNSIIDNQRDILLSVQGTNIWSGQGPQKYNSQAIAWGGLGHNLFGAGKRYQWVAWAYLVGLFVPIPFWLAHRFWPKLRIDYLYTPVICYYVGWLSQGINSQLLSYFMVACVSQWYLRTRYPHWFQQYNYILAAALDGGTQVMVFILSFAIEGASGSSHLFPQWWGATRNQNYDRCIVID